MVGVLFAEPHQISHSRAAYLKGGGTPTVEYLNDFKRPSVVPFDGKGYDGSIFVMACIDFNIPFDPFSIP